MFHRCNPALFFFFYNYCSVLVESSYAAVLFEHLLGFDNLMRLKKNLSIIYHQRHITNADLTLQPGRKRLNQICYCSSRQLIVFEIITNFAQDVWRDFDTMARNFCTPQVWYAIYKYERLCLTKFPYTEKRVENTTCSGEFLTSFEVFGNTVFSADISTEKLKIVKIYSEI